ncbi:histidine kinase [Reichenbachiella carrageenanivorans]|uniref:Histidine kinase n=1 Tax=Reichenbachiella carrageenanivorans TaxID=2979869 RepID=A0ABY6D2Y1_9BACT|nr:histidine kinase [Reichenbachiella carrageenanivorans]UXX80119.1 histidine kinase [Reichenbachiella carrageenanivorans]
MRLINKPLKISLSEVIFQLVLHLVVFVFYAYSRHNPQFEVYEIISFLNYMMGGLIINYWLLPSYLYAKKYLPFFLYFIVVVAVVILIEEGIIENIFFPDTRGKKIIALSYNLLQILPILGILSGFKFAWDALGKEKEMEELRNTIKESELQFLKSQINPHFLFNNLNNIYAHAIENSPQTPTIILELSSVLRYMLYECKAQYVPLSKEIEQLNNFINLNNLQIEGRGGVTFTHQDLTQDYRIAPLILMVFVENAFKHSSSSQTEDIKIAIDMQIIAEDDLVFSCTNTYLAETNTQDINSGIGLENVRKRLQLLYPEAHELTISRSKNEYQVYLKMNLSN